MLKSLIRLTIIICLIYLWVWNPIPFVFFEDTLQNQNQSISQSQQIFCIRSGAFDKEDKDNPSKIPKSMLEKYFPDWTDRINYQNQQFEFLQSGIKKIREATKLRMTESQNLKLLTSQEKDAFDYFRGTGFYQSQQDVSTPPNIFDTRDTFLKKMQNFEMRNKFLNTYNKRK